MRFLHGQRPEPALRQLRRDVSGLLAQARAQRGPVVSVAQEGVLAADALNLVAQIERARVVADGKAFQLRPPRPNQRPQVSGIILQVAHGAQPGTHEILFRDLADAVERTHRQRAQERDLLRFVDERQAVGLFEIAGELGQQLIGRDADGGRDLPLRADELLESTGQR